MFIFVMIFYGLAYYFFESVFNLVADLVGWYRVFTHKNNKKLRGWCSIYMALLGSIMSIGLWGLFLIPVFRNVNYIWLYALLSGLHITLNELLFGYILNVKFGLKLWDYSKEPFNFVGQISFFRSVGWLLLSFVIYYINTGLYQLLVR